MDDRVVNSWAELTQALYDIPKSQYHRHRSDFVYRGLADKSWGLETSLLRLGGDYANVEKPLLRSFRKYAEPGSIPADTLWVQLSVAQHHGLPTRLLDWTISPKIAVHFATAEEEQYDKDGAIWCINVVKARSLLPSTLREILKREYAYLFSVEMLESINNLAEFDSLAKEGHFVLFFEPPSLDSRIVNQWAMMSVMPGAELVLSDFLHNHPALYHRIIIPQKLKWEIRDKLDQDNVTERMLFPGLDGLSRWLKRYYGQGPSRSKSPPGPGP
ncbi:MAG: FRG domain-containing protein [Nitrospira sp. WS238]|nr:FRG domain-containing protein [Nitrospira sp. WS238]